MWINFFVYLYCLDIIVSPQTGWLALPEQNNKARTPIVAGVECKLLKANHTTLAKVGVLFMSKQRIIKDEMWDDEWFYDLDPSEKLVWVFLLTNPRSNIAGIYKLNFSWASSALGFDVVTLKSIVDRFVKQKKVVLKDNWVIIWNFHKHQSHNPKVESGVVRIIEDLPSEIRLLLPIDSLCIAYPTLLNSTLLISTDSNESGNPKKKMYTYHSIDESGNPMRRRSSGKGKEIKARNAEIIKLGFLFEKMGEKSTGVKPDLSKAYFIIKNAKDEHGVTDFESLFKHFFSNTKLAPEQKVSLAFCCSPSYITQWKVTQKNKTVSQVEASSEIEL